MIRMFTKTNTNDFCRVKLTPLGYEIHRKRHFEIFKNRPAILDKYMPPARDEQGWTTMQLWEVMQIFGSSMGLAQPLPIATEMMIQTAEYENDQS